MAAAAATWGTLGLASRSLFAAGMTPLDAATWRAVGGCVLLLLYGLATDRRALRVPTGDLPLFAAYGLVGVAGFMTVYYTAIALTTVATAAVLLYTAPAWVVLLARLLFGEPLSRPKAAAVAAVVAGCALVAGGGGPLRPSGLGVLAGLGAGLTYSLYSIFGKAALRRYAPLTTVIYALGVGGIVLLLAAGGLPPVPAAAVAPLAYTVAGPTALAYLLYTSGLRRVEAGRASVVATIEPVVAAAGSAVLLREPLGPAQWLGAALVLAGVLVVQGGRATSET
ncbi:MAG: EamA family transporter [Armatimonadota bacterium]|nr:EamA family transporter [Armatimonadota bacterium]